MREQNRRNAEVDGWLKTLGVKTLSQWDVLVFLCRHLASLVSAEHIAWLLGYDTGAVVAALDSLEKLGLVDRSRVDQGVRLYQYAAPASPGLKDPLGRLLTFADSRAGRLLLIKKLRRSKPPKPDNGLPASQVRGGTPWLKAI